MADVEESITETVVKVSPYDFINPPFIRCPKCGAERFGILSIAPIQYSRRCKLCLYPKPNEGSVIIRLPKLSKSVIYLDQFVISEILNVLNPKYCSNSSSPHHEKYVELFSRLDVLSKKQAIICPSSSFHENESIMTPKYRFLRDVFRHLSCGVTFQGYEQVVSYQIVKAAKAWLLGEPVDWSLEEAESVTYGQINEWQQRFRIDPNFETPPEAIEEIRQSREQVAEGIDVVFSKWCEMSDLEFSSQLRDEISVHADQLLNAPIVRQAELSNVRSNFEKSGSISYRDLGLTVPNEYFLLWGSLVRLFNGDNSRSSEEVSKQIREFLNSQQFLFVPAIRIPSALWAQIANMASNQGMSTPPNRGTTIDFRMLGVTLPYCDAVFVDKKCHSLILEKNVAQATKYQAQVFSLRNFDDFIDYLDKIESELTSEHKEVLATVYGEDFLKPFTAMFKSKLP